MPDPMTPRDSIDPLDTRNPWPADGQPHIGMTTLRTLDGLSPSFVSDETIRTIEQAARREERHIEQLPPQPRFVPALAHEDTVVDFRLTDGDRFRPEDTLVAAGDGGYLGLYRPESPRVMEREMRATERRHAGYRLRRAIGRRVRGT